MQPLSEAGRRAPTSPAAQGRERPCWRQGPGILLWFDFAHHEGCSIAPPHPERSRRMKAASSMVRQAHHEDAADAARRPFFPLGEKARMRGHHGPAHGLHVLFGEKRSIGGPVIVIPAPDRGPGQAAAGIHLEASKWAPAFAGVTQAEETEPGLQDSQAKAKEGVLSWPACPVFCRERAMGQASCRPIWDTSEPKLARDKPFRAMASHEKRGYARPCPQPFTQAHNQAVQSRHRRLGTCD